MSEEENALKLLAALSDPKAAKSRLEEIELARGQLEAERKKFKTTQTEVQKAHDEASTLYKKASEERLIVERRAKDAEETQRSLPRVRGGFGLET